MPSSPSASPNNSNGPLTYQATSCKLGRGSFSVVRKAIQQPSGKLVAAKQIDLRHNGDVYKREVHVHSDLDHPNIVKFLKAEVNFTAKTGSIFMELLTGPNFYEVFVEEKIKLPERKILEIILKLSEALSHMHSKGYAHRDLKPENICLLNEYEPILFDFGLSYHEKSGDTDLTSYVGSPLYMSPEVLLESGYNPFSIDVWGLGIILYSMIHGDTPNSSIMEMETLLDVMSTTDKIRHSASSRVAPLLDGMLAFNPSERWSLSQIRSYITDLLS